MPRILPNLRRTQQNPAMVALATDSLVRNGFVLANPTALIGAADANAQSASYVEADMDSIATLANAIKTLINGLNSGAIVAANAADQTASFVEGDVNTIAALLSEISSKLLEANPDCGVPFVAPTVSASYVQTEAALLAQCANTAKVYINDSLTAGLQASL